jgi:hypothetical protein
MPTTIHFLGGGTLEVIEAPEEVHRTFSRDRERVVELTERDGVAVYLLAGAIAYWRATPGPAPMQTA